MRLNKKIIGTIFTASYLLLSPLSYASLVPDLGDENCSSLILVSAWNANNVKIYDGCSGEYIRNLDSQNLINGPLGILQAPDGDLLVVSENNHRLLKFDRETLSNGTVILGDDPATGEVEDNFITKPSAAVIDESGFMYAASFTKNSVVKIDTQSWQIIDQVLAENNGLINGIDAGISLNNGNLYLPGFYSDNVVKINLHNNSATTIVANGAGGLNGARAVQIQGANMLVAGEYSNSILVFDATTGSYKSSLVSLYGPTGMRPDGDNHLLVSTLNKVYRLANDASSSETLISNSFSSGTFVYRMNKVALNNDEDGDGLSDEDEVSLYGTNPDNPDTDGDTLSDGDEVLTHGSNPLLKDSDADGMPDDFEVAFNLLVNQDDAAADLDNDGLTNYQEFQAGTQPDNQDTDGDGILDGADAAPLVPDVQPSITGTPTNSIEQDADYLFQPEVSYAGDISTVSLSISNKPAWANFDTSSGKLSGTPRNVDVGITNDIVITVTNGYHQVNLETFNLEVVNINDAPQLVSNIPDRELTLEDSLTLDVSEYFADIDIGDSLTFSATGLPSGLAISSEGVISGTPTSEGIFNVTIVAMDQSEESATQSFTMTVKAPAKSSSGGGSFDWLWITVILMTIGLKEKVSWLVAKKTESMESTQ